MVVFVLFKNWIWRAFGVAMFSVLFPLPTLAQNWVVIEARDILGQCQQPITCVGSSEFAMRSILNLGHDERNILLSTINSIATIRGLPEEDAPPTAQMSLPALSEALHPLPKAEKLMPLVDHPGVYFDSTRLDEDETTADFSAQVRARLSAAGVRFLTEEEMEATPGRPTLVVSYAVRRESAGCIIPFGVSMSINEETAMVRNPAIKLAGRAWSKQQKENLANNNYTPIDALTEVLDAFVADWTEANL